MSGMAWLGMVWVWLGMTLRGMVWVDLAWLGLVWLKYQVSLLSLGGWVVVLLRYLIKTNVVSFY